MPVTVVEAVGSMVMLTVEVPALNLQLPFTVAFTVMVWLSAAKAAPPMSIAAVAQAAGNGPEEIVYVGDSYEHDIVGPAAYGMRTVWLNRKGLPVPGQRQPDAVIDNLMELPRILEAWR